MKDLPSFSKPPYIGSYNLNETTYDMSTTFTRAAVRSHLKNLLIIIRPNTLQPLPHRLRILAYMLTIPPITTSIVIRERRFQAFKRHICAAHDRLAHIVKAVNHMPVVIFFELVAGRQAAVNGGDGVEAVQLVRHGCGEDGGVGPDDGGGEVVVVFGIRDGLEAHADWEN
jgi:hypothetical protein